MTSSEYISFGRHRGLPYTRVPVSYLRWMINCNHPEKNLAEEELKRRGSVFPNVEISGHAIDRVSLRCLDIWQAAHRENEGIHAWLVRICEEALKKPLHQKRRIHHMGLVLIFEYEGSWPVLKTAWKRS